MRGKEEWVINNINYVRITPAYAGKRMLLHNSKTSS